MKTATGSTWVEKELVLGGGAGIGRGERVRMAVDES